MLFESCVVYSLLQLLVVCCRMNTNKYTTITTVVD